MTDTQYQLPEEKNRAIYKFGLKLALGSAFALCFASSYPLAILAGMRAGSRQATESAIALIDDEVKGLRGVAQNLEFSITNMTSEVGTAQTLGKVTGLEVGADYLENVSERLRTKIQGDEE